MTKEPLEIVLASVAYLCFGAAYVTEKMVFPSRAIVSEPNCGKDHEHIPGPPRWLLHVVYWFTMLFWWGYVLGDIFSWATNKLVSAISGKDEKSEKEKENTPDE